MAAKNNDENREKLACNIVEGWDLSDIIRYAIDAKMAEFEADEESFQQAWHEIFNDEQVTEEEEV